MSGSVLFELGLEEVPAGMVDRASADLARSIADSLQELDLVFDSPLKRYSTPRRLTVIVTGLPQRQADRRDVVTGPPKARAFGDDGKPTPAALGFARKMGAAVEDLEIAETPKGAYLSCPRTIPGKSVAELLPQLLQKAVRGLHWPKNMYWRPSRFRFIRPIRWIAALFDRDVIDLEIEGVRSARLTFGHRFLSEGPVEVESAQGYLDALKSGFVVADPEERRSMILDGLHKALPKDCRLLEDDGLVDEVVNLNEYPTAICGGFDPQYLKIPREVLITVMRFHQKYFAVQGRDGALAPHFITVLNTAGDEDGRIRKGHEKVLRARLDDAAFFWDNDRRVRSQDRIPALENVLFQDKLGSYGDKTRRLQALCAALSSIWPQLDAAELDLAAQLCKTDLVTDMVGELPELQGVMGGLYGREEGLAEGVWRAVYQHYRPVSLEDGIPQAIPGAALSLADRLDTIVGCFGNGIQPTGSRDPLALRRLAQGAVKILLELGDRLPPRLSLKRLIEIALEGYPSGSLDAGTAAAVYRFLIGRIRFLFEQEGLAYDVLNAVLAVEVKSVRSSFEMAQALSDMRKQEDFEALASAFKRIRNILSKQSEELAEIDESLLQEPAERSLHSAFRESSPQVEQDLSGGRYAEALSRMARLRGPVDDFFDQVLVMAEDEGLRSNRLRLLHDLSRLFLQAADISEIVQSE